MQVRGNVRRKNVDGAFALSDHADWDGLLQAIKATGAEKVYVTHGYQSVFSRYLNENGIWSAEVKTEYGEEDGEKIEGEAVSGEKNDKTSEILERKDENNQENGGIFQKNKENFQETSGNT